MKIATNITREHIGGITRSNISFLDFLYKIDDTAFGIELMAKRTMQGATIFNHLSSERFEHFIVNMPDFSISRAIKSAKNIRDLEKKYKPIIKIIKDILNKNKPDVVFLNGTYYIPWLISIAAHELKIPIVSRYAGVYSKETEGLKLKSRRMFNDMEKSFQKRVDFFIFPSALCQTVVEDEIIGKKIPNSIVIPNPFNLSKTRNKKNISKTKIAAIGRWDRIKNFKKFFEIHKLLNKEKWTHTATFVTNNPKIKLLPKTIEILPPMEHQNILDFYSSQGLIICPSLFETFGNVPIEAICMGIPVLVSDNMGCAEVMKKVGLENMVISFTDNKEILDKVKELCGKSVPLKCVRDLKKILDPNIINNQIMSILKKIAKAKK